MLLFGSEFGSSGARQLVGSLRLEAFLFILDWGHRLSRVLSNS
jgi:hypothetical protein